MKIAQVTDSKYSRKVKAGKQMYGPGCCGHDKPANYNHKQVKLLQILQKPKKRYSI